MKSAGVPLSRSRRALFRSGAVERSVARPPWALSESLFLDTCTRCDECVSACPERVLVRGDGGFPEMRWGAGECSFCEACIDVCVPRALDRERGESWPWRATVGQECLGRRGVVCQSCGDICPVRAIRFAPGSALPMLDANVCTGCGACVGVCPAHAMAMATQDAV